jgi:hypothetical protein
MAGGMFVTYSHAPPANSHICRLVVFTLRTPRGPPRRLAVARSYTMTGPDRPTARVGHATPPSGLHVTKDEYCLHRVVLLAIMTGHSRCERLQWFDASDRHKRSVLVRINWPTDKKWIVVQ